MKPDLCSGCADCPLASFEACAPPSGPVDAKLLVVGEAPGKDEAEQGAPFVGRSGTILRSALQHCGIDPTTEVRYVNTVQCRPPNNDNPEPIAQARCTVLSEELARFKGRAVLAVGKVAFDRLFGRSYSQRLGKARSGWDGYIHPIDVLPERVDLGHELGHFGEVYKSGPKKGQPKQTRRLLAGTSPRPANAVGVGACLHPSAVMRSGFSNVIQFQAGVQRAVAVANGHTPPSLYELSGIEDAVEYPHQWEVPGCTADLVFDIENTPLGVTDISFVEVFHDGTLGQRASFSWTPAAKELAGFLLGPDSPYKTLVAHNAAYDAGQLPALGDVAVRGAGLGEMGRGLACTMMAAQLDQPDLPKALSAMWRYCPPMPPWKHVSGSNMRLYNLLDSVVTAMAWAQLRRRIVENGQKSLLRSEMASIMVLDRMTRNGLPVDLGRLQEWLRLQHARIEELKAQWTELTGLEVQAGKQVLDWLFEQQGAPVLATTENGQPKLDKEVIGKLLEAKISDETKQALRVLKEWKKLSKLVSTYGDGYEKRLGADGCLHPSYLPDIKDSGDLGTAAGRLSSSPNVQNVPKSMRWVFRARPGWVIGDSDLRAVEGRVQAVLADDTGLLALYDREGWDMHRYNLRRAREALRALWKEGVEERTRSGAKSAFAKLCEKRLEDLRTANIWPISRKTMKTFLYGWNYGAGDPKIAKSLGIHLREAEAVREAYEASRPATARWRKAVVRSAAAHKKLQNAFGRIRYFYGVVPEPNVRNQAINFFPQSTVADMFWTWFPKVESLLAEYGGHLITQVHDSFVWTAPRESVRQIVTGLDEIMTQEWPQIAPGFRVPATHDVGPSWGEVEPFDPKEWTDDQPS